MKRLAATIALLVLTGCGTTTPDPVAEATTSPPAAETTAEPATPVQSTTGLPPEYPSFVDIDPYTSYYFIALEDTDLEGLDQELMFNIGIEVCRNLDDGGSIEAEIAAIEGASPTIAAGAGTIVGAAVSDFCPHHGDLIEAYLEGEAPPTTAPAPADGGCDPNYGGCVPVASDVDCAGGTGDGPAYAEGPVEVVGSDVYGLDPDGDGVGCD